MTQIDFKAKEFIRNHHLSVPDRPIKPDAKKSVGKPRMDGNLIIHGDNLHALKSLLPMYGGRVNCIYIDPPYNTGEEGWCYNDNVSAPWMQAWLQENPVGIEDGLRHDKWCVMMWPRLVLLRELLAEDGVMFISIDDNEQHRLRMMLDEIFGDLGFVGNIAWESKTKSQNTKDSYDKLQPKVEHILCYSKKEKFRFNLIPSGEKEYLEKDEKGKFRYTLIEQMSNEGGRSRESMVFPILNIYPKEKKQWKIGQKTIQMFEERGDLLEIKGKPYLKMRPSDERTEKTNPFWAFFPKDIGTAENAKKELSTILDPGHGMETVKPMEMIRRLLFHSCEADALILDSFAGSGTTAHAVLDLNKQDGGDRKFILVECEDYSDKMTAERVRRVIRGVPTAKKDENLKTGLGGEFTYCTLGEDINMEKILNGKKLPTYEELAEMLFRIATDEVINPEKIDEASNYIGESADYHLWLIYKPSLKFLLSSYAAFTLDGAKSYVKSKRGKKRHLVFAAVRFVSDDVLTSASRPPLPVDYLPLPWALYRIGRKKQK